MANGRQLHRITIYVMAFVLALHITPTTYINSSFLSQFVGEDKVGYIFTASSILAIISLYWVRGILRRYGNYNTFISTLCLEFITLLILVFSNNPTLLISSYIIGSVLRLMSFFHLDIFLESLSDDKSTGGTRGIYLTAGNLAFIIGPLISGLILTDGDFSKIYLLSSLLLLPVFYITVRYLGNFKDPVYRKPEFIKTAKKIYAQCNYFGVFVNQFLLSFFYSWMVIYMPIYLNQHIGFSIAETATIIGIALIPFVLLQAPLGRIADKYLGEKEILTAGFIVTAVATSTVAFVESDSLIFWAILLFITRIGASVIEIMSETDLFRKITDRDINILGFFRVISPVAYISGTLIASLLLIFIDFKYIFLILGAIMLYGIRYSLAIRDTK